MCECALDRGDKLLHCRRPAARRIVGAVVAAALMSEGRGSGAACGTVDRWGAEVGAGQVSQVGRSMLGDEIHGLRCFAVNCRW